jgi:hypothetical protein
VLEEHIPGILGEEEEDEEVHALEEERESDSWSELFIHFNVRGYPFKITYIVIVLRGLSRLINSIDLYTPNMILIH